MRAASWLSSHGRSRSSQNPRCIRSVSVHLQWVPYSSFVNAGVSGCRRECHHVALDTGN